MNVVPLVDVVLVLLIIFMVTATAAEFGLELEVPKVRKSAAAITDSPVISITKKREVFLGLDPTKIVALAAELRRRYPKAQDVIIRSDKSVPYEEIVQVLSEIGNTKLKVKLATQAEEIRKPVE
jgi:biopolymer transport protein ExbD